MKKLLLFSVVSFYSMLSFAQVASDQVKTEIMLDKESMEEILPYFDAKVFHDRQIMSDTITWLYLLQQLDADSLNQGRVKTTKGVLSEKDSDTFEKNVDAKRMRFNLTDDQVNELLKKVDEDPAAAFRSFLMSAKVPRLTTQELNELNTIDEKAIPKRLEMVTESGPDIGANQVPVMYFDES